MSVARVCVFFPFCLLYIALLYCIWSLSSISISREAGFVEEAERETARKDFLGFITVHKNGSQFCM